jgi:hypothetical protein
MTDAPQTQQHISQLATAAAESVINTFMNNFQIEDKDKSWRRAMFRQGGDYGCTMVVDVHLIDGDKSAHIITKMGKA